MKGMIHQGWLIVALALLACSPARLRAGAPLDTSQPIAFFTNLASRLLKAELNLDLHRLQIYPTNQYTPAVHRLLQVTANLYDAINPTNDAFGPLPTVFRPRFKTEGSAAFIAGYEEVVSFNPDEILPQPLDLSFPGSVTFVKSNSLIFGVPFVLGARKWLPNFNEFASESVVQITRKVELRKASINAPPSQTNQMFIIGISNGFGAEFWNSYTSNYTRPVEIAAINWCLLELTNDFGFVHRTNLTAFGQVFSNSWPAWNLKDLSRASLIVPLRTNHIILPNLVCAQDNLSFISPGTPSLPTPTTPVPLALPRWGLTVTNRVVAYIRDSVTGRLVDYVQFNGMVAHREITAEMAKYQGQYSLGFDGLWATNSPNGIHLSGLYGVINQIQISKGDIDSWPNEWQYYGINQPAGATKDHTIAIFRAFFTPDNRATYRGYSVSNTNLTALSPFTPTWKQSMAQVWQANDPLIHYTTGDMEYLERSGVPIQWFPPGLTNSAILSNLGRVNERYLPWGGNPLTTGGTVADPNAYNHTLKDPLVRSASNWDFPEGEPLSLAMLRRVHRGTPWQTIYLKSGTVTNALDWQRWTGNRNLSDAEQTLPKRDWKLAGLIASLSNTNHPRTLLSVNERDTNAWLAALNGIEVLTNSATEEMLANLMTQFDPLTITSNSPQAAMLVAGVQASRAAKTGDRFNGLDELLAVPALTGFSPYLNHGFVNEYGHNPWLELSLNDAAYEAIPVQLLSRLRPDSLGSIARDTSGWRIQFTGCDGFRYAVEQSTNLLDWQAISTNEPTEGVFEIALPEEVADRFYRSALLP